MCCYSVCVCVCARARARAVAEDLDVKIDGPSKADIVKKEEKDGIMTYVYVPVSAGEYNINIRFKNKHIHGSPFAAKISGNKRHSSSEHGRREGAVEWAG